MLAATPGLLTLLLLAPPPHLPDFRLAALDVDGAPCTVMWRPAFPSVPGLDPALVRAVADDAIRQAVARSVVLHRAARGDSARDLVRGRAEAIIAARLGGRGGRALAFAAFDIAFPAALTAALKDARARCRGCRVASVPPDPPLVSPPALPRSPTVLRVRREDLSGAETLDRRQQAIRIAYVWSSTRDRPLDPSEVTRAHGDLERVATLALQTVIRETAARRLRFDPAVVERARVAAAEELRPAGVALHAILVTYLQPSPSARDAVEAAAVARVRALLTPPLR